jgi:hypothetical protein
MKDTDFDHLCAGATPEEAKRLRKLLTEWARGDENAFPVQLALLTKAQWRSAATVPRMIHEARQALQADIAKSQQDIGQTTREHAKAMDNTLKTLDTAFDRQRAEFQRTLGGLEACHLEAIEACGNIRQRLQEGGQIWKGATESFLKARDNLLEKQQELNQRLESDHWFALGMCLLLSVGLGFALGWHFGAKRVVVMRAVEAPPVAMAPP